MAIFQPSPRLPSRFSLGTITSSRKSSQNSAWPVICVIGRMSTPADCMSTISIEMPLCLGPSVSVRASTPHQRAYWPQETQVLEPLSTKWSSSSVARVRSDARSEPASGSLKPWHQISSAERIEGMYRRRCSSLPKRSSDGPSTPSPTTLMNSGAPAAASSWSTTICSTGGRPPPPNSLGQARPT